MRFICNNNPFEGSEFDDRDEDPRFKTQEIDKDDIAIPLVEASGAKNGCSVDYQQNQSHQINISHIELGESAELKSCGINLMELRTKLETNLKSYRQLHVNSKYIEEYTFRSEYLTANVYKYSEDEMKIKSYSLGLLCKNGKPINYRCVDPI